MYTRPSRSSCKFLLAGLLLILAPDTASATHLRSAHVNWADTGSHTIRFRGQIAVRRSGVNLNTSGMQCVGDTLNAVPCSGSDGYPIVGDVFLEYRGGTRIEFGDGTVSDIVAIEVTAVDLVNDLVFGNIRNRSATELLPGHLSHTYPGPGVYSAVVKGCCRVGAYSPPNEHINNPVAAYSILAEVDVGSANNSPASALPPIINCPIDALCQFPVPGADLDGDTLSWRMSTATEAGNGDGFDQPGPRDAPNAASIDPNTGIYSWDTTGAALAVHAATNALYSTQVTIEDGSGSAAVDFLISLVEEDPNPPDFTQAGPVCGATVPSTMGGVISFTVDASDPDAEHVSLNVAGIPAGATMGPGLPSFGNPVSSGFSWSPGADDAGAHVITFTATSTSGGQALCPVTIEVTDRIEVAIDIKPHSDPSCFNNDGKGVIPVAILGSESFDVADVDVSTLSFAGLTVAVRGRDKLMAHDEEYNGDGFMDLVVQFQDEDGVFAQGDGEASVTGTLLGGAQFQDTDAICVTR